MNSTTKRLMAYKNLGRILFNSDFSIVETDHIAKSILKGTTQPFPGSNLLEVFPELIGNEELIQEVLAGKVPDFRLDHVNRKGAEEKLVFLNFFVLAEKESGRGLVVVEDVTQQAKMLQELNQQKYELLLYKSDVGPPKKFLSESILGNSPAIQKVRVTIEKLSEVPKATVLLQGETGTGKNLVARVIHYSSMPLDAPFVDINCAALPENLVESELFGYEKGAFTHATVSRPGLLEVAQGGTILLDEIGELPLNLQAKLLSVLETKQFRRLGSNKPTEVKVRAMAATNRDLHKEVVEGRFREDLYHRLNVVSLPLPPLRDLGDDIILIAAHFLKVFILEFKKKVKGFTPAAEKALLGYTWPGNVRELSNCLERAMIFIEKDWIDKADLIIGAPEQSSYGQEWAVPASGIALEEVERQLIISALRRADGNKSKAARLLGLTRDTLRYRLDKHQLS
jgi:transcriptional regulator with PAS, ATPase and Fis domain